MDPSTSLYGENKLEKRQLNTEILWPRRRSRQFQILVFKEIQQEFGQIHCGIIMLKLIMRKHFTLSVHIRFKNQNNALSAT